MTRTSRAVRDIGFVSDEPDERRDTARRHDGFRRTDAHVCQVRQRARGAHYCARRATHPRERDERRGPVRLQDLRHRGDGAGEVFQEVCGGSSRTRRVVCGQRDE